MNLTNDQLDRIDKVSQLAESTLESEVLTKEQIDEIDEQLSIVLAELGSYKRYFKRLA